MKSLTSLEKPSIISFRRACSGFPIAERNSSCSESRMWSLKMLTDRHCMYSVENRPMRENIYEDLGTIFRIGRCFQRNKQKLYIYFSLEQGRLKIYKAICACIESTDLIS